MGLRYDHYKASSFNNISFLQFSTIIHKNVGGVGYRETRYNIGKNGKYKEYNAENIIVFNKFQQIRII